MCEKVWARSWYCLFIPVYFKFVPIVTISLLPCISYVGPYRCYYLSPVMCSALITKPLGDNRVKGALTAVGPFQKETGINEQVLVLTNVYNLLLWNDYVRLQAFL